MENIILEKSYTKCGGEASSRPFYKKSKIDHISGSTAWNAIKFAFSICPSRGLRKRKSADHFYLIESFKKTKSHQELVFLHHFLHDFQRKIFLNLYFVNWPNCIAWLRFFFEILGNMYIVVTHCPVCDVINFESNLRFLIKPFFYLSQKLRIKESRIKE